MTGIERLRDLAGGVIRSIMLYDFTSNAYDRKHGLNGNNPGGRLSDWLTDISYQIEREHAEETGREYEARRAWQKRCVPMEASVVMVLRDMERHVSGVEGMEDSPVARWARELRKALDGRDDEEVTDVATIRKDAYDAYEWVREHGGLDYVRAEWRSRVPYDRYEARRQCLLCHIAECETALGRRNRRIEELGHRVNDLTTENAELRKRAIPEGMEWLLEVWPMWSNGEYCRFGDWWTADRYGDYEPRQLRRLVIYTPELLDEWEQGDGESYGYEWDFMRPSELGYRPDKAMAPEPAVPASDGEPLEVGQTVWDVDGHGPLVVRAVPSKGEQLVVLDNCGTNFYRYPEELTHERPDSWERIEEDAERIDETRQWGDRAPDVRDLVRRCKALAGVSGR